MSLVIRRKVTLGVVIGSRAFFSPAPCKAARDDVLAQLERLGIEAVILPYEATANGAVQSVADADLYARHFRAHADRIDGLVICLPNLGDEIAIAELVNRARLNVPILLQASNDEVAKVSVKERRDAFCGKISVTNNFWQYGIPFTETTRHTCDTWGEEFGARPRPVRPRLPHGAGPARRAAGFHRGADRGVPDHALFGKAVAGGGSDGRHRRPVGNDGRGGGDCGG